MKKNFLLMVALAALIIAPATVGLSQDAPAGTVKLSTSTKQKKWPTIKFYFTIPDRQEWPVSYPEKLLAPTSEKPPKSLYRAVLKDSPRGVVVSREIIDIKTGLRLVDDRPLKDVVKIEWKGETQLNRARNALMQGRPADALGIAERFLLFFKDLKTVPGSLWLEAAVIKLDALDRQENDSLLDTFIREIESSSDIEKIEGLSQKIKLVRLRQQLRKGEFQRVLTDATDMLKKEDGQNILAQLTMLKGRAEFNLGKYEEALYTFLKIPVFYGNQAEYVPSSKLEVARCMLKLDTPERKAQNLPELAEAYILEVITEYPMTPEAKDALALLPKDKQDKLATRDSLAEAHKQAMASGSITSSLDSPSSEQTTGADLDINEDSADFEIDDSDTE